MKRFLIALPALLCLAAPALADPCSAATEVATRAALDAAQAANRRTAIVRVACGGTRETLVLHRVGGTSSASVTVRAIEPGEGNKGFRAAAKTDFSGSSQARVIRVRD
jgi:hypothetical protein